ncbi:LysM peptidoglycan-binding domain-containing protein [Caproicibacter sp.]|uniref:CIS tube protein n=1 Tax=Caproicibacter sp. TaxID=2814884 RepID=UPI003988F044
MEKAVIAAYNLTSRKVQGDFQSVQFNPNTYSVSRTNTFQKNSSLTYGRMADDAFLKSEPATLSVELLFDTFVYEAAESSQKDVRDQYRLLRGFTKIEPDLHSPPHVRFSWGKVSFVGDILSIQETFTMFAGNGIPVRAKVALSIQGCYDEDLAVSSNNSPDRTREKVVCQGDTLWSLAQQAYGSPELWRTIAKANGIENPRKLSPAVTLTVPALPGGKE